MSKVRKLIVEVIDARDLLPKDGQGTSSPYVVLDYYGQRRRTFAADRTLNPTWNEKLDFNAGKSSDVFEDMLEVEVYHDKTKGPTSRNNFLGRLRLNASQFVGSGEEALIYYTLEKKHLFNWIKGELGLKIYYVDEVIPPPPPPAEEAKPPAAEPTQDPPGEAALAPTVEPPSNGGDKPSEEQPAPPTAEVAPPPPPPKENAAPEAEKPSESKPPPQVGGNHFRESNPPPKSFSASYFCCNQLFRKYSQL